MRTGLAAGVGLLVGVLIGLTGMGAGAVITPFLILVMRLNPVTAVGTDLVFSAATKLIGGFQHRRLNHVRLSLVGWMALGSLPASFLAAKWVLERAEQNEVIEMILPRILGVVLILVAFYTFARAMGWVQPRGEAHWPPPYALTLIGALGGLLVGLTSVGSGTVIMALLLVFYALPPAGLVGLDVLHGAALAAMPALLYALEGEVDWGLAGWLLLGSIPGAWLGAHLTDRVSPRLVRGGLSLVLLFAGARLV